MPTLLVDIVFTKVFLVWPDTGESFHKDALPSGGWDALKIKFFPG